MRKDRNETLASERERERENLQIARRGQGPLSFWRTIGVVRPKN